MQQLLVEQVRIQPITHYENQPVSRTHLLLSTVDATRASVLPATQKSAPQSPSSGLQFPPSDPPSYESTTPLALFAQNYRSLISPQLESKLKAAGYLPHLSPGIISEELWRERYGLSDFELAALKEAHEQ